ncbi:hypothetical protein GCM10023187_46090 [Nibrella viscosa]|uniref:Uncharacterized protein n=1 Tax=Nibrella viscosa TaxID=1084524 RepID=A0ABP8KTH9_9BACT
MISQLRKRHVAVWTTLAIALPVGFLTAYQRIPATVSDQSLPDSQPSALPEVVAMAETPALQLVRRANASDGQQLEVIVRQPLTTASALVYWSDGPIGNEAAGKTLLGRLGPRGTYRFAVPDASADEPAWTISLYDGIKSRPIDTILLKP